MSYDDELAERIRDVSLAIASGEDLLREQRMFGGLAFLVAGKMAVAASGRGGLMVRVDPEHVGALQAADGVEPMMMRGRELRGWLHVSSDAVRDDAALAEWVTRGVSYARSLPAT